MEDDVSFIYVNAEGRNTYLRVMPASMLNGGHYRYDRNRYVAIARRIAWNLLIPFVPSEDSMVRKRLRESRLETYFSGIPPLHREHISVDWTPQRHPETTAINRKT